MRPRAIILFERLLLAAVVIDLVNNFASWPKLASKVGPDGTTPSPLLLLISCIASPLIGLAFWYLIARRGSVIAKWMMTILVALATIVFIATVIRGVDGGAIVTFAVAVLSELLKVAAVTMLFTAEARAWLARATRTS